MSNLVKLILTNIRNIPDFFFTIVPKFFNLTIQKCIYINTIVPVNRTFSEKYVFNRLK